MTRRPQLPVTGVDTHAHVFRRGLPMTGERRYTPDYDAPLDAYLAHLDRSGLSHGVLVQPSFLGTDNSFMRDALRCHPDRLRGVAMVDPDVSEEELVALEQDGVTGIRFNLIGLPLPDYTQAPWTGLFRKLVRRGFFVEIHRQARDLKEILPPLLDAGLQVVVDHFGRTDPALGLDDAGFRDLLTLNASGRVWVKLSATYRSSLSPADAATMTESLRAAFGIERLLWGSDWPHTQFEKSTDHARERALISRLLPDEADCRSVLVTNPAALYRLP